MGWSNVWSLDLINYISTFYHSWSSRYDAGNIYTLFPPSRNISGSSFSSTIFQKDLCSRVILEQQECARHQITTNFQKGVDGSNKWRVGASKRLGSMNGVKVALCSRGMTAGSGQQCVKYLSTCRSFLLGLVRLRWLSVVMQKKKKNSHFFYYFFKLICLLKKIYYKVYLITWNACSTIYNLSMWVKCE